MELRPAVLRTLRALVEFDHPAAITDLTPVAGGHPNSVRLHLESLLKDGLVELVALEATGRGRPAKLYQATIHGRQLAQQDTTPDDFRAFVDATIDHLAGGADAPASARALGRSWGQRLTERSGTKPDMMETLAAQGFTPTVEGDVVLLRTCPFVREARRQPELICSLHQGLLDVASDYTALIKPFSAPSGCVVSRLPHPESGPWG